MDFIPVQIAEQMILNKPAPSYEPLSELMKKVFGWIGSSSKCVTNIQSLWSKFAKQGTYHIEQHSHDILMISIFFFFVWYHQLKPNIIYNRNTNELIAKYATITVTAIDTDCSAFHDEMYENSYHVRFIRVGFVMGGSPKNASSTFRTFSPVQLGKHGAASYGQFESLSQTMSRVQAWLEVTGKLL